MHAMVGGNHPTLVYTSQSTATNVPYDATTLWRYDTSTASATKLVIGNISRSAGISPDGQWVLLTAEVENRWALQLIRVDGQQLQTLYCAPGLDEAIFSPDQHFLAFVWQDTDPNVKTFGTTVYTLDLLDLASGKLQTLYSGHGLSGLLFSPDQRSLVFVEGSDPNSSAPLIMNVLDLTSGKHHAVLSAQQAGFPTLALSHSSTVMLTSFSGGSWSSLIPLKWINNNRLLIRFGMSGSPCSAIRFYLLHDISKDASQQQSNLQFIAANDDLHHPCDDVNVTPDGQQLVYSDSPMMGHLVPATISTRAITGGNFHTIYRGPVGHVRVDIISNSTLLIIQEQVDHPQTVSTMNINGSGLTQLMATPKTNEEIQPMGYNGSLYALGYYSLDSGETTLVVGSLAGSAPKTIATTHDILTFVGWTQM